MLPRARELAVGDIIDGKYRILGTLGSGGMGTVYAARRLALGDVVALKTALPGLEGHETRRRFLREAQAAASIRHPNVIQVFDFGNADAFGGTPYLVMELVEGPSLGEELRAKGTLPLERALRVFSELCAAVEAGHRRGIVHRDLKPGNVMLAQSDDVHETVKVLDFGIAKLDASNHGDWPPITQEGAVLGTFQYLAPEQLRGEPAGAGSDVWALAIILYEMLTGRLPFAGQNPAATLFAIASGTHAPARTLNAEIPHEVDEAIERALHSDPLQRPSARALAAMIGAPLPSIDARSRPSRWSRADDSGQGPSINPAMLVHGATLGRESTMAQEPPAPQQPFVGRDAELRSLHEAWLGALRGEPRVTFVSGEAGIGKTRLLAQFLDWARGEGAIVRRGAFFDYEGSQPRPFATFLDLLEVESLDADAPGPDDKWRAFQRIADLFANDAPTILAFEDVHWARALDLELILHLHRALARNPTMIVTTARGDAGNSELARFVGQLGQGRALSVIELAPFSGDGVRAWLVAALGDVRIRPNDLRKLERATGGNPYFLDELLRHLVTLGRIRRDPTTNTWTCEPLDDVTLPPTLGSVVRAQIDALGEQTRDVLETAAVIGDELRFDTLRAATELDEDALDELVERAIKRRLLTEDGVTGGNDLRFVSDTTRRVLYEAMSPRRRRRLHRKVVDALHVRYGASLRSIARILCYHHHAVGDFAEAMAFGVEAAEDDLRAHDVDRAESSLRRARDAEVALRASNSPVDRTVLAKLDWLDGSLAVRLGLHERARSSLRRVLDAAAPAELRLEARLELVQAFLGTGDNELALEEASAAIGLARTTRDIAKMHYARIVHAGLLSRVGRVDAAIAELRAVVDDLDDRSSPALRSFARRALAWDSIKTGSFREGEAHAREALELARRARDPFAEHQALSALAAAFAEGGDSEAAIPFQREALAIARALSFRRREAIDLANLGESHMELHHLDEALALFNEALAIFVEIGDRACEGDCAVNVGRALLALGRHDDALARLTRGLELCEATGRSEYAALARLAIGEAHLAMGRPDEAIVAVEAAHETFTTQRLHHLWAADWALARAKRDRPDEARAHAELAAEELRTLIAQAASKPVRTRHALAAIERFLTREAGDDDDERPTNKRL